MLPRLLKGIVILALLGITALACLTALLWIEHRSELVLPTPTGPFAVGRSIQVWTMKHDLLVWIWYPAAGDAQHALDDYLPRELRPKPAATNHANIWTFLTRDAANVREHSIRDARMSPRQPSYPLLIMRAGASASVMNYSTLAEDLASHGYVVVGFDAPYRTSYVVFPDGRAFARTKENDPENCVVPDRSQMDRCASRIVTAWTGDIASVLDRLAQLNASDGEFAGRLDMNRIGIFGHSFGGAVAAQFCHEDSRCKAVVDLDGAPHGSVIESGLRQPVMFLLSDHSHEDKAATAPVLADIRSMYDRTPPDRRLYIVIRGAFHYMFSDDGALLKSTAIRGVLRILGRMRMTGRRQLAVTAYCLRTFFDATLNGSPLNMSTSAYPELEIRK